MKATRHVNFEIKTNKKSPMKYFNLCITGRLNWPRTENPTRKEIIEYLKEMGVKEFSKPNFEITPEMVSVKLSA